MAYPSTIDTFAARTDGVDEVVANDINIVYTTLEAMQTELGTDPAGSLTDVKTRLAVSLTAAGYLAFQAATGLTISSGAITVSRNVHTVDTEGSAASDDLDTINGAATGFLVILRTTHSDRDIVVKHGAGNITCAEGADFTLTDTTQFAYGFYDSGTSTWYLARSIGGGSITASGTGAGQVPFMSTEAVITSDDDLTFSTAAGLIGNETGGTAVDLRWESDNNTHMLFIDASADKVGVNQSTPTSPLHVKQSGAAGAIPAFAVEQSDQDESFINFIGTSAADQTKSISTVNGDGTVEGPKNFSASAGWSFVGMIRIEINGAEYWMPYYSADTA